MRAKFGLGPIPIRFTAFEEDSVPVAAYNGAEIVINSTYVSENAFEYKSVDDQQLVASLILGVLNGLAIHEAGHSIFSDGLLHHGAQVTDGMQIVEDWFLEMALRHHFPVYTDFMDALDEVFFPSDQDDYSQVSTKNFAVLLKHHVHVEKARVSALEPTQAAVLALFNEFEAEFEAAVFAGKAGIPDLVRESFGARLQALFDKSAGRDGDSGGRGSDWSSALNDLLKEILGIYGGVCQSVHDRVSESGDSSKLDSEAFSLELGTLLNNPGLATIELTKEYPTERQEDLTADVNESFVNFASLLRKEATITGASKAPTFSGRMNSHRLSRAVIDGRIFTPREGVVQDRRIGVDLPNVGVLLDVSGSTEYIFKHLLAITKGLIISFEGAGVRYYVSAHGEEVSLYPRYSRVVMMPITEPFTQHQNVRKVCDRISSLRKRGPQNGNADHVALKLMSAAFPKMGRRIILVISDGLPSVSLGRESPTEELANTINQLRKSGFTIGAITYGASAARSNSALYGREFTLDATECLTNASAIIGFVNKLMTTSS
jgi:hypothetical protein